jgi:hypothetical protein
MASLIALPCISYLICDHLLLRTFQPFLHCAHRELDVGALFITILTAHSKSEHIAIAEALELLGNTETALSILNNLVEKNKETYPNSTDAIEALGRLGKSALPILSRCARDEDELHQGIRIKAVEALGC